MSPRFLEASINGRAVGTLKDEQGRWAFTYDRSWLSFDKTYALSPHLPLQEESLVDNSSQRQVQWYFDNLLPEEGQRALLATEATIHQADAFALLEHYGAESAGSLTLLPEGSPISENDTVLLSDAALEKRIGNLPNLPLAHGANKRMSLAGAQHKLAVIYTDNQFHEPQGNTASTHILKPDHPSTAFAQSVINEWFVMQLAGRVGLNVPPVHRRYVPSSVYVIDRFDRTVLDNTVYRLHSIDACQLLGIDATFKYQQGSILRLAQIAERCRSTAQCRTRLFSWLVFNVLVGNTDAHLKNLSFMVNHEGIELSPLYDLLSTAVYETKAFDGDTWPTKTRMAWPLPDAVYISDITRDVLLNAAIQLGLNKATANRLLKHQLERIVVLAHELNEKMLNENAKLLKSVEAHGVRMESENRCVRSIIYNIIEPMVQQVS
jgi:serine/threonine-protein kinase HipA